MVDKVARLHFQPASPAGALRALSGWLIAITGLALLVAQLVRSVEGFELPVSGAVTGGAMAAAATALGAVPLLVVRRISANVQGMLLGFGAGVMLAASVFSLLLPAFEAAQAQGFNYLQRMGYIILPQSIPVMLPPMVNQVVNLFKNTSCLYIVGGADLISVTYSFVTGASTGGAYAPAYIVCGLIFFVVCFPLSTLAARWEASLKERKGRVNTSLKTAAKKVELKEAA